MLITDNRSLINKWIKACSKIAGCKPDDIIRTGKRQPYAEYRHLLAKILREDAGCTYQQVGIILNRNHPDLIKGIRSINNIMIYDAATQELYNQFKQLYFFIFHKTQKL